MIRNANVLRGPELRLEERTTLVLEEARIAGVGKGAGPPGSATVDASGLLVVPGFVDAHVHIGLADPAEVLRGGVTTVRDLGWPRHEIFPLARRSEGAGFGGPLILAAGPIHTAPGGYPTRAAWAPAGTGYEVADQHHARAAVCRLAEVRPAAVKFALNPPAGPVLDHPTLRALVEQAHTLGLKATGHVHGTAELVKALDCGADELAHMLMSEEEIPDVLIRRMASGGMTIVPTLSIRFGRDREIAVANLARFRAAGGRVVYGTDLGNEGPRPGIDPSEVRGMTEAGYTAAEVVAAATVDSARYLGLGSKGVIETGRDADLVAVPLDALEDAALLADVRMVWRAGRRAA